MMVKYINILKLRHLDNSSDNIWKYRFLSSPKSLYQNQFLKSIHPQVSTRKNTPLYIYRHLNMSVVDNNNDDFFKVSNHQ